MHAPACGRRQRFLDGACDTSQWLNITFQDGVQCILLLLSLWFGACSHQMHDGVLMMLFFFSFFLSLFNLEKYIALVRNKKSVLFVKFITFDPHFFNCIKFILLFYDVLGLTLNFLIYNLDSQLFYQILISFQFYH